MNKTVILLLGATSALFFNSCMNMPTKPNQITGTYVSSDRYDDESKRELNSELSSLKRREAQLHRAQEQRYKTSQVQAFWWGFGNGDSIEAAELASVRGEIEAVQQELDER